MLSIARSIPHSLQVKQARLLQTGSCRDLNLDGESSPIVICRQLSPYNERRLFPTFALKPVLYILKWIKKSLFGSKTIAGSNFTKATLENTGIDHVANNINSAQEEHPPTARSVSEVDCDNIIVERQDIISSADTSHNNEIEGSSGQLSSKSSSDESVDEVSKLNDSHTGESDDKFTLLRVNSCDSLENDSTSGGDLDVAQISGGRKSSVAKRIDSWCGDIADAVYITENDIRCHPLSDEDYTYIQKDESLIHDTNSADYTDDSLSDYNQQQWDNGGGDVDGGECGNGIGYLCWYSLDDDVVVEHYMEDSKRVQIENEQEASEGSEALEDDDGKAEIPCWFSLDDGIVVEHNTKRVRVPIDDEQDEKDESEDEDDEQEVENKQELCTRCSQKLLKFVEKQLGQSGNHLKVVLESRTSRVLNKSPVSHSSMGGSCPSTSTLSRPGVKPCATFWK